MASNWRAVRAERRQRHDVDEEQVSTLREQMRAETRAYKLAEIRKSQHITQKSVADRMGVKQPRVSAIEHGELDRAELGTIQAYVEALGGEVRILAEFGEESVTIG